MKSRSAKAKGRRLQQQVRDLLLERFSPELEPDDIRSAIMGEWYRGVVSNYTK